MNVNTGGTEVTGTTYTTETITTSTVTIRVRATTGTYLSVPTVSETLTMQGNIVQSTGIILIVIWVLFRLRLEECL